MKLFCVRILYFENVLNYAIKCLLDLLKNSISIQSELIIAFPLTFNVIFAVFIIILSERMLIQKIQKMLLLNSLTQS